MSNESTLRVAPQFELPNQKGQVRSLAEYLDRGAVLLAFHRGTW
jgi:peroxiredoxin